MQAFDVPGNWLLLLYAAGPVQVRPAEEIVEADPVRDERDPAQEDDQRGDDKEGNEQVFHGYHQDAVCRNHLTPCAG